MRDSPAEHVGTHTDGGGGCLAVADSGGIAEAGTPLTGGFGCLCAHAVSVSSSAISISPRTGQGSILGTLVLLLGFQSAGGLCGVGLCLAQGGGGVLGADQIGAAVAKAQRENPPILRLPANPNDGKVQ